MTEIRWKFLREHNGEIHSQHGNAKPWEVGKWKSVTGEIYCCDNGFHSSPTILAALSYVHGEILAQVECTGASHYENNKSAHRRQRIVKAYRWTKADSVTLAVFAAEKVLHLFEERRPGDDRPRKAIEAAKAYLAGTGTNNAAADADAAVGAAYAAYAYDAAAAAAAYAHAADAAREHLTREINAWLEARVAQLEEIV